MLIAVGLLSALSLAGLIWLAGRGRLPHWVAAGLAAAAVVAALVLRRDIALGLVVPHVVGRRGPYTAATAFGVVLGAGLARQRRGFWAALLIAALAAPSFAAVALATCLYALVRCSVPLLSASCRTSDCVLQRLERQRAWAAAPAFTGGLLALSALGLAGLAAAAP